MLYKDILARKDLIQLGIALLPNQDSGFLSELDQLDLSEREEILEERFADVLKGLVLDDEVMGWITEALRESHNDAKRHHDAAIARLQSEYTRLQNRIDAMYLDKLDGRVGAAFFDRKAAEWRTEQDRLLRSIEEHQAANQTYLEEGVRLLELAQRAHELFQKQEPREKRRLLNFLLSNCSWEGGELKATFRQPFDILADANSAHRQRQASMVPAGAVFENWLPFVDTYRTFCLAPGPEAKDLLLEVQQLTCLLASRPIAGTVSAEGELR